jgi:hypothetical protein
MIVTHFDDRPDNEVAVHGPYPFHESLKRMESILADPKWNRPIPREPRVSGLHFYPAPETFRDTIEGVFLGILDDLRGVPFQQPSDTPHKASRFWLPPRAFVWYLRGNLFVEDPSAAAFEIIRGAKDQAGAATKNRLPSTPTSQTVPKPGIVGHGGFIFPPVWIGEVPRPTFAERASGWRFLHPSNVFEGTYRGRVIVAERDGFVVIAEADKAEAVVFLNEIMAIAFLNGKAVFAFRELEVGSATLDPRTKLVSSKGVSEHSIRAPLLMAQFKPNFPEFPVRRPVSVAQFQDWVSVAEKISVDQDLSESLVFLLEGYTHLLNSEYLESFVVSWVIIEKHLYKSWERFLRESKVARDRREKMKNPILWSLDPVIETLSLMGKLSADEYAQLMRLKKKRNDIVHEGERVSKKEAEESLEVALGIVKRRVAVYTNE